MPQQTPPSESGKPKSEFEQLDDEQQLSLFREFVLFISENKKWYLVPLILVLSLVALLVVLGASGAAPFIYPF